MAQIEIYVGEDMLLPAESGVGFYGDNGFGAPVPIGSIQGRTFVTDPTGEGMGLEMNNCKLYAGGSFSGIDGISGVIVGQTGTGILLRQLPNYLATFNFRFTHSELVRTQNVQLCVNDRVARDNDPSGLLCYCAEIRHPDEVQSPTGSGDAVWLLPHGSETLGLIDTPGTSGLRPSGSDTLDTRHDWYVAMAVSPTSPGDKSLFGMMVELEYL